MFVSGRGEGRGGGQADHRPEEEAGSADERAQRPLITTQSRKVRKMFDNYVWMGTGNRKPVQTGLSIAVNQSKTGPPSTQFGFLCMHRVPGGVIKLSAPTSSLASQCLPSVTIKQPFQNLSSLVPCPLSLCSEAF